MDYGELKNDTDFIEKSTNIETSLDKIQTSIETMCEFSNFESLSIEDKVKYDLYLAYSLNSLYWMYCKIHDIPTIGNNVSQEMFRVREAMVREKTINDRNNLRPKLNVGAAKRFIRHELWDPKDRLTDKDYLKPKKKPKLDEI